MNSDAGEWQWRGSGWVEHFPAALIAVDGVVHRAFAKRAEANAERLLQSAEAEM